MNGQPRQIWLIALIIVLAVARHWYYMRATNKPTDPTQSLEAELEESEAIGALDVTSPIEAVADMESAELEAVEPYIGSGTATRTTGGRFIHEVIANIDDPARGKFYEGWLVGAGIVSTGKLVKEAPSEWSLIFDSDQDLSDHNNVVITEETEADGLDGKPETHVLEGSFTP